MTNMSYCRFQNTFQDLQDCYDALYEGGELSEVEGEYRNELIKLCSEISSEFSQEENEEKLNNK